MRFIVASLHLAAALLFGLLVSAAAAQSATGDPPIFICTDGGDNHIEEGELYCGCFETKSFRRQENSWSQTEQSLIDKTDRFHTIVGA